MNRLLKALALAFLLASLFLIDVLTPLALSLGSLYVIPIFLAFYLSGSRGIVLTAITSTLLIVLSYSFPNEALAFVRITNRVLATTALWIVAFFAMRLKSSQERLKQSADELERSNVELDQFASMASHDLRSHIANIKMVSDFTDPSQHLNEEEQKESFATLRNSVKKMENLVSDLLDFARASKGSRTFETLDLNDLVHETIKDLQAEIAEKDGEVEVSTMPVIKANRVQMKQLFQNLITNSLKYTKNGAAPRIEIESGLSGHALRLSVRDNGLGFDMKDADKLFAPFERLHSETPGTGLGLPICGKVARQHGGRITVRSRPGKGSVFHIDLPNNLLVKKEKKRKAYAGSL